MKNILLIFLIISFSYGYSTERKIGDVLQIGIPITAAYSTYYMNDLDGFKYFLKSYLSTVTATHLLKVITQKRRPDSSDYLSFPSGHTSSAFSGASFIHYRYGFKYSIPFYLLASFTGYSRVQSKKHYTEDVVAGAGLAILNSWYFTSPYSKKYSLRINYNQNLKIININFIKLF